MRPMQGDGNKVQSSLLKNSCEGLIQASASEVLYVQIAIAYEEAFNY